VHKDCPQKFNEKKVVLGFSIKNKVFIVFPSRLFTQRQTYLPLPPNLSCHQNGFLMGTNLKLIKTYQLIESIVIHYSIS